MVADVAFRLPDTLKIKKGLGKWLLRRWLDTGLPEAKAFARKKGFTVPVGEWIAQHGAETGRLVASQPGVREVARASAVEVLFSSGAAQHGQAAWTLLSYALWHQIHILGGDSGGSVAETLAERP